MQTLLVLSGTLITLFMLKRLLSSYGLSLFSLNPLVKRRQRHHTSDENAEAIFRLTNPLEIAALYIYAVARADGDLNNDQKNNLLELFQSGFQLSINNARNLLATTANIYSDGVAFNANPKRVLEKAYSQFSSMQIAALEEMLVSVCNYDEPVSKNKQTLCGLIISILPSKNATNW